MIVAAQGKSRTAGSATLGKSTKRLFPSPRPAWRETGRGIKGEGFLGRADASKSVENRESRRHFLRIAQCFNIGETACDVI